MVRFAWMAAPVLAVVAVATAGVTSAAAATRHVAPGGAGGACSAAAPCGLEVGIGGAAAGDEVVIAAGGYTAGIIEFPASGAITVRGAEAGAGRPVVTAGRLLVRGSGSLLSDVALRGTAAAPPLVVTGGARGERLLVTGAPELASTACGLVSGTLANSVCRGGALAGSAGLTITGPGAKVRNVTAISGGYGVLVPSGDAPQLFNTIAEGDANDDVNRTTGLLGMSLSHSYAVVIQGGPYSTINRVSAGLAFRDAAADLRQAAGSTTIDAGTAIGVVPGELDLNGNLRAVGGTPDIGAYEQVPAPSAAAGTVEAAAAGATIRPVVTTAGGRARVTVLYGAAPGVLPNAVHAAAPASAEPGAVEVPVANLAPYTTYHYRVIVASDGGTGESAEASFTTAARPAAAALGAPGQIGERAASVVGTVDTGGAPGQARFELAPVRGGPAVATPPQELAAADGPRRVTARVTGLAPGTEYRLALVLTTPAAGTIRSAAVSLTTKGTPELRPGTRPGATAGTTPGTTRDTRRPRMTVRLPGAVRIGRRDALVARVTCDEPCALRASARLGVRGGKPVRFRLLPNARITLRLKPVRRTRLIDVDDVRLALAGARRAALTALRAGRRVVVRIDVQATDAAGNVRRVRHFVAVRP